MPSGEFNLQTLTAAAPDPQRMGHHLNPNCLSSQQAFNAPMYDNAPPAVMYNNAIQWPAAPIPPPPQAQPRLIAQLPLPQALRQNETPSATDSPALPLPPAAIAPHIPLPQALRQIKMPSATEFRALPLPPTAIAHYIPTIGWVTPVQHGEPGALYNAQVGWYQILKAQRFIDVQQLADLHIPPNTPYLTESESKKRKRDLDNDGYDTPSGNQRVYNPGGFRPLPPHPPHRPAHVRNRPPPRPSRTTFPYNIHHPITHRPDKGKDFEIRKACICDKKITLVPRPNNGFMLFRSAFAKKNADETTNQSSVSKAAGEAWKKADLPTRQYYAHAAQQEVDELRRQYPNYKYVPGARKAVDFGFPDCFCGAYAVNMAALEEWEFKEAKDRARKGKGKSKKKTKRRRKQRISDDDDGSEEMDEESEEE